MVTTGVLLVAGYGSGISHSVASKFGSAGFKIALLARTQSKLDAAAAEFSNGGVTAKGYSVDLASFESVKATVAKISNDLGPITVIFWNPYGVAKGLFDATYEDLVHEFSTTTAGLVAAVQASYQDLKAQASSAAVLVTGGGLSLELDATTQLGVDWGAYTLATAKAAQRKLVHLLNKQLGKDGIYATELTVLAAVKGTPFDADGTATLTSEAIADRFWQQYQLRDLSVWSASIAAS